MHSPRVSSKTRARKGEEKKMEQSVSKGAGGDLKEPLLSSS